MNDMMHIDATGGGGKESADAAIVPASSAQGAGGTTMQHDMHDMPGMDHGSGDPAPATTN